MRMPCKGLADRPGWLLAAAGLACLYLQSFLLPSTPIYQGDTIPVYLLEARRMLAGQVIYRDFFEFTLPGLQTVYLLLFKLFGVRAWIPNATFLLLGLGLAGVAAVISKRLMVGRLVWLPSVLFLAFAFSTERDPTHHWYSTLAAMAAVALLLEERSSWRLAGAGALCGLSTLFTQNRGGAVVLGIALFLVWEYRAKKQGWRRLLHAQFYLWAGFLATTPPVLLYFVGRVGLQRFLYCILIFPLKYYPYYYWNTPAVYMADPPVFPFWLEVPALSVWLFMHLVQPLIYLLFLARYLRQAKARPGEPWERLMLLNMVGIFLFLGIAFSPNWFRLCSVSLPALILFVWFLKGPGRIPRLILNLVWVWATLTLLAQPIIVQTGTRAYLDAPVGRLAFLDSNRYAKYRWVLDRTRSGDFFFQADDVDLYFPLGLRNPTEVSFVTPTPYTRPEQVRSVVEMLDKHRVRFVIWSAWLDVPREASPGRDPLGPLRAYLHAHYHAVKSFSDADLQQAWERNP
jgi:hypothetical protein